MLQLERCHTMNFDTARRGEMGYHGEKLPFYARRALMLPGNGTSVLEAQDPAGNAPHITWREVRPPHPSRGTPHLPPHTLRSHLCPQVFREAAACRGAARGARKARAGDRSRPGTATGRAPPRSADSIPTSCASARLGQL